MVKERGERKKGGKEDCSGLAQRDDLLEEEEDDEEEDWPDDLPDLSVLPP